MIRLARCATLLAALLQLSGCVLLSPQGDVLKQVQGYEAAQEYGKALELIAAVPANHPQRARLAQKKVQIEAKAKLLEQGAVRRAGDLMAQNRWNDALNVYREAMDKLPRSQVLRNELQELRRRQAARVEELKVDQLVGKARWLERSLPLQQSIVATDPENWAAKRELDRLKGDAAEVAKELTEVGLAALDTDNLGLAGRTLPIASRLAPSSEREHASNELSFQEARQEDAERNAHKKALLRYREQEGRKLLDEYHQAARAGDLRRAHIIMGRLQEMDGDNPEVVREGEKLDAQLDVVIKKKMDEGNSLYGRGEFKGAMAAWNKVLELDPENEKARSNLERASRVVDKLKQLRQEQSANPSASGL